MALVARYDLAYEVRDRARFLSGLVSAGGIGRRRKDDDGGAGAKVVLSAEDFARGVSLEDVGAGQDDGEEEKQTMTGEQVRAVLFEGKAFDAAAGLCTCSSHFAQLQRLITTLSHADRPHSNAQLGTLSLSLASSGNPHAARPSPFGSSSLASVPPYPTSVPPSSVRDPPSGAAGAGASAPTSRSHTPLQGFGSESFRSSGTAPGQAARVVLTPGSGASTPPTSMLSAAAAAERKKVSLNEFFESSSSGSEEEEDDDETEGEDDDESSEGEEEEEDEDDEEDEEEDGEDGSEGEDGEESEGSSSSGDDDPSAQAPR